MTGAAELVGAGALLLVPEPTMVTKLAGGALALHGSDVVSAGMVQIATGSTRATLTAQGVTAAAETLGASSTSATRLGAAVDIAVPLAAGFVGALRALAVRRGVLSLAAEETAGGHTIARMSAVQKLSCVLGWRNNPRSMPHLRSGPCAMPSAPSLRRCEQIDLPFKPGPTPRNRGKPRHSTTRRLRSWAMGWCARRAS